MKQTILKFTALLLLLCFSLSFASCIKSSEARELTEEMFLCLAEERYDDAEALCHPIMGVTAADLKTVTEELEKLYNIDVSEGIVIERVVNFNSAAYTSQVDGAFYEMQLRVTIGNASLYALVAIASNDDGYGICKLYFQ